MKLEVDEENKTIKLDDFNDDEEFSYSVNLLRNVNLLRIKSLKLGKL